MKKSFIVLAVMLAGLFVSQEAKAQNVVEEGVNIVNVGVGFLDNDFPISVGYDYGLSGQAFGNPDGAWTLGALAGAIISDGNNGFFIGPRVGLHYHFVPQLDTYISLMIGFENRHHKKDNETRNRMSWGTHVGARYFFSQNMGAFVELGYGYSFANVGLTFRF